MRGTHRQQMGRNRETAARRAKGLVPPGTNRYFILRNAINDGATSHVRLLVHEAHLVLPHQVIGAVRELGLAQARLAEVLFPVDGGHILPSLLAELLVDERIETPDLRIRLLDMDDGGVAVEKLA